MASNESDHEMTKPFADMTDEEYAAERAAIAAERAELERKTAALTNGNGEYRPAPVLSDALVSQLAPREDPGSPADAIGTEIKPEPWLHDTKTLDDGHVLEYRKPDSSAMIAISMVGMDGFTAQQQSELFNKFMGKHLSLSSLVYVLGRMADPDDDFGLSELITVLTKDDDQE